MAMDGSFRLAFELERFISRCPRLANVPELDYLLKKGENVMEEEVVEAMGELFLHPKYSIPMLGCFRPIAHKIVQRSIYLLQLVPDLRSNSHVEYNEDKFFGEVEDLDDTELMHVVDIHVRSGKGLSLHELACLAFCRALDLFPFLLGTLLDYFRAAPSPFERIKLKQLVDEDLKKGGYRILKVVQISYRLLLAKPEVFTILWDWSCYLDFVHYVADTKFGDFWDIHWCIIQIVSLVLKRRYRPSSVVELPPGEAFLCLLRWNEFCQDVSLEKAGWFFETSAVSKWRMDYEHVDNETSNYLESSGYGFPCKFSSELHDNMPLNQNSHQGTWNGRNPFILTAAVRKSFEMVFLAVSQRWPVLLYGPGGVGKTAMINKLAQDHGSQVLTIHMDEQIDGKTLVGSYVCTEKPGEFIWQPGSLAQAVSKGHWVVFEDIDKAPPDVQSILLPLLEGTSSISSFHGEAIKVHERFRLFSTVSSSKLDVSSAAEGSLSSLWRRIMIGPPRDKDLLAIVKAWYPEVEPLVEQLIETFLRMNQLAGLPHGTKDFISSHGRFSIRDLLKWCKRIMVLGLLCGRDYLSLVVRTNIYKEAVDVFAAYSTSVENRLKMMKDIAKLWSIDNVESIYPVDKPVIQEMRSELCIGRVNFHRHRITVGPLKKPFVQIHSSVHVLERIACSVKLNEPVLLVGETGTGKTTLVQSLAEMLAQKLTVLNLSQQSDVADLLGGFRPMDAQFVFISLYKEFETLFTRTFSSKDNEEFLLRLKKYLIDKNWKMLLSGFQKGIRKKDEIGRSELGTKRKRPLGEETLRTWKSFSDKVIKASETIGGSDGMIFSFVEGSFVTALRNGEWILLDEINLAPPETLQRVIGVLEAENGSLCLAERGDIDYVPRHPNFRIFACMNPATDAGKRDLPFLLRSRFTEYFVDDVLDDEDLILFIKQHLDEDHSKEELVNRIVNFYRAAKRESEERLQDGANQKPQFSLRSLYRALGYVRKARKKFMFDRALYDGFCMFFMTLLDGPSAKLMNQLISSYLLGGKTLKHVPFGEYLICGQSSGSDPLLESYILTKSVKEHLSNLARAIFIGGHPVLLQGPTSSGKTSLVQYLAAITGKKFVRINNHEHTDLQEYLGAYITDSTGKLVFQEGILVKAVRNGYWIVLDELNLAPSDVLEALNRLLDDNRELFVPELREIIPAHPDFMLFATQNPPNFYGGRKMLSRAFRNRFVEIHVDEIPECELSTILEKRCAIPESYAKKMIDVMKDLQLHRQRSKVFAGKQGYITPRDLFRWAGRFRVFGSSYKDLALDGYYLLAERLRDDDEKRIVKDVLERHLRVKLSDNDFYKQEVRDGDKIIWTQSMCRLFFLVERCYKMREPVLLVGETGGGKTSVCQLLSVFLQSKLHILNCHQYTETSDFLGGFYPVRNRSSITSDYESQCKDLMNHNAILNYPKKSEISSDINEASRTLKILSLIIKDYKKGLVSHPDVNIPDIECIMRMKVILSELHQRWQRIFIWQDGPLVEAMKNGDLFLVDEISLADDSVLERLNSVLEPERKLSLAEKGGSDLEIVTGHQNFFLMATMNPGGDYGKKELSPALRNRFTEIWVPSVVDLEELKSIGLSRITDPHLYGIFDTMLNFWEWFNKLGTGLMLTVRDFLSWVSFINVTKESLQPEQALLHGAYLVLLDGLNLGTSLSRSDVTKLMEKCVHYLVKQPEEHNLSLTSSENRFGIHPFYIEKGSGYQDETGFQFAAPTTLRNAMRVLRAMQVTKPVLIEGSPGVGKTSLIAAIGKFSGHTVVRINLSEQTDIMDLLGSDLPVESDERMQFAWSDGILLQALKNGSWVILDELNLAPQSVLEGLNAILDHRAEVFIPELGRTFKCPASFRVFACQNPFSQGGGRKGLPKSFLNRFTKVYVDELVHSDYITICNSIYPSIPISLLEKLVSFNKCLHEDTMLYHKFAQDGSPWEFNLRDVIRSCEMINGAREGSESDCFLNTLYVQRMRTPADRFEVIRLYEQVFGHKLSINPFPRVQMTPENLIVGNVSIKRNLYQACGFSDIQLKVLPGQLNSLEAVVECVKHQWMCILVGPPSSGKTSLIRLLAQLTGNVLHELNLSSTTDISELLGCFEQYNVFRNYRLIIAQVEKYMNEYCSLLLDSKVSSRRKDLFTRWFTFLSETSSATSSTSSDAETWKTEASSLEKLINIVEDLMADLNEHILPVAWSCKDLDNLLLTIMKLEKYYSTRQYSAKFEWVTGQLLKAIENGEWIVLENANLCNPTVLDRINSLVEQSGSITVNECGTVDGQPVILHPHPQFRMFLTVNPSYGDVSRAMRNRGVEIYLMQPFWLIDDDCNKSSLDAAELRDAKRFIVLSGVPFSKLVVMMANAHIYARHEGSKLGVAISYLELARWIQLLQQLITGGNQAIWSLQVSWEHIYLSSLGDGEGKKIVDHVRSSLSILDLQSVDNAQDLLICLPGGWPKPLNARDFVLYPKETCVRKNCMYLEFLGAQIACSSASITFSEKQVLAAIDSERIYLMNARRLYLIMFPMDSNEAPRRQFNSELTEKMLFLASNWAVEQAIEKSDMELYLCWFSWFNSHLEPFCSFFNSFLDTLKEELEHPIWKKIFCCHKELLSHSTIVLDDIPPILSMDFVDLLRSVDGQNSNSRLLLNLIHSVSLLRLSYWQWRSEANYVHCQRSKHFKPILNLLQVVEKKVLGLLLESPSFDVLLNLYNGLLEHHLLFWNSVKSLRNGSYAVSNDFIVVSWRSLLKKIGKLKEFCPEEVDEFWNEAKMFKPMDCGSLHSEKSLLWLHGGHPYLPHSGDIYKKQHQLLELCGELWQRKTYYSGLDRNYEFTEDVLSFIPELRSLILEGVSMSSYIVSRSDEDDTDIVRQLEEMYQMLSGRMQFEKQKLLAVEMSKELTTWPAGQSVCCGFFPDLICRRPGFSCLLEQLPILDDSRFFFDMVLLPELSQIPLLDIKEQHQALSNLTYHLKSALKFLLNWTSRCPTDLVPHQKVIWTVESWESVPAVDAKISSYVLEMWLRWHSFLWMRYRVLSDDATSHSGYDDIILPHRLFHPLKAETVHRVLGSTWAVRDYPLHSFKLRVASSNLLHGCSKAVDVKSILQSAVRSLFQQIIHAHKSSYEAEKFTKIMSFITTVTGIHGTGNLESVMDCLASSNHQIFKSLLEPLINPLLAELYGPSSCDYSVFALGYIWLRIGVLRYHLLISCDDIDPAVKYSIKYSQLMEKIASLELEIEVRQECSNLAGCFQIRGPDKYKVRLLELQAEKKKMQRKIVYRPHSAKFRKLKKECDDFLKFVSNPINLMKSIESSDWAVVKNFQQTATCFIERLSQEYHEYSDVIEPVQVAVYEMKLGLSLAASSASCRTFSENFGQQENNSVLDAVYSFMRFPRRLSPKDSFIHTGCWKTELAFHDIQYPLDIGSLDDLEMLVALGTDARSTDTSYIMQFRSAIYKNVLLRIVHSIAETHILDNWSFSLLDKIFESFATSWMHMKEEVREKEDNEAQQFKFRPRAFRIENIMELDISTLRSSVKNESFSEWQELATENEFTEEMEVDRSPENLEHDWSSIEDPTLNVTVDIHNQLFGSQDLIQIPGVIKVSDADKQQTFLDSYMLGIRMVRNLTGLLSSNLDAKLVPEHLFRLCLEHEKISASKSGCAYNFYKDSNAPMMAKMVDPLMNLRETVFVLVKEFNDHPALMKILDVIEMVLAIPLNTPLAKALSGLHFLLNRIQTLQETVAKFPLSDTLKPVYALVSAWQKLEYESWPALLDDVESQFETNAGRLWFPLYSVLWRGQSTESGGQECNSLSTFESLSEFIRTSSIGEFRKRIQLLLAFHGHISHGMSRGSYSSPCLVENLKILYNMFGFYVQFLPKILEHIRANRRNIDEELEGHRKLCGWEHNDNSRSMENSRRARHKLRKIIQRHTTQLEQSVELHISEEVAKTVVCSKSIQCHHFSKFDVSKWNQHSLNLICNGGEPKDEDRLSCSFDGQKKVQLVLETLSFLRTMKVNLSYPPHKDMEDLTKIIKNEVPSQFPYLLQRGKQAWDTIRKISKATIDCDIITKDEKMPLGKRRVFSELLEVLESCGLSKRMSTAMEDQLNTSKNWHLQPSYCVQHLLLRQGSTSVGAVDDGTLGHLQSESSQNDWKTANEFYFKSIMSRKVLQLVSASKDFTCDQVEKSRSSLDHLISIQQEQRAAVYGFAKQLKLFRQCLGHLDNLSTVPTTGLFTECSFASDQLVIFKFMWQQKQLLDNWCNTLKEVNLLIKTIENGHLDSCSNVKEKAKQICLFVEKFLHDFQNSKNLLDVHLLGEYSATVAGEGSSYSYSVTKKMKALVGDNFQLIRVFGDNLNAFIREERDGGIVKEIILGNFKDSLQEASFIAEKFNAELKSRKQVEKNNEDSGISGATASDLEVCFLNAINEAFKCVMNAFPQVLLPENEPAFSEESLKSISKWKSIFELDVQRLNLDYVCDKLLKTTNFAGELLNYHMNSDPSRCLLIGLQLRLLCSLLDVILVFSDQLLHDFLTMHRMVSEVTHLLAEVLASLFTKGYGIPEEQMSDSGHETTQDASGTGMGEGTGTNDVSDQIQDEDQLLGASEKPNEEDNGNDVPSKNDKGIEMEQDFAADILSMSEESGDEEDKDDDKGDEQLDSAIGNTGADSEAVDEKSCDRNDDQIPSSMSEKYEQGPSIEDNDSNDHELRGKEDPAAAADEAAENHEEFNKHDESLNEDPPNGIDDLTMDKENAFSDPSGLNPDEPNKGSDEDVEMDEVKGSETMEDYETEEANDADNLENGEEQADELDGTLGDEGSKQLSENSETDNPSSDLENDTGTKSAEGTKEAPQDGISNIVEDNMPTMQPAELLEAESGISDLNDVAPEAKWSNCKDNNDLAPMRGLPDSSAIEISVADSSEGKKLGNHHFDAPMPPLDSSSQKIEPNPCRNLGEALDGWKERVKVSVDLQDKKVEDSIDLVDENANEYGYTAEFEKGTAQALGPATLDQIDKNLRGNDLETDSGNPGAEDHVTEMEIDKQLSETCSGQNQSRNPGTNVEEQPEMLVVENQTEESMEPQRSHDADTRWSQNLVSMNRSYLSEDIDKLGTLTLNDEDLGKAYKLEEMSAETRENATVLWRKYELLTTRLSQELAEQLRLVMEPTLASKLQGDYRTGKRINMKKVIPYIASHYRKDKIWLRRTRPNKRNYQVVVAVDDSSSMQENSCGNFAVEALVTVCRAMSQLEVGNLAVASFGKKGNIRMLHNFDQPFSSEAGIKMISSLTFKQENTIGDEPMVDLLKYLNNMLDGVVVNSRLPSGHNPLQQLVLVIADGRFHEKKEKLKRYVRDLLSRKRMVAFLLLDSPEESITELMEPIFEGGNVMFSKYLESFPFPYYVVLKNIEALPRTLADLLRQWFEIMQQSRE